MTANDSKSYLGYLNKLVDEYNNNYHRSIGKKSIDADYYVLTEKKNESIHKALKFRVGNRVLLSTRIFLVKVTPQIDREKYLLLILY